MILDTFLSIYQILRPLLHNLKWECVRCGREHALAHTPTHTLVHDPAHALTNAPIHAPKKAHALVHPLTHALANTLATKTPVSALKQAFDHVPAHELTNFAPPAEPQEHE